MNQRPEPKQLASYAKWPEPKPLPGLASVKPFDLNLLPESLRPWIADIAERMQRPPDFPAVAAVIAMATLVGRKLGIRPKRRDDWLVVPNLWGGVIARPSLLKTPSMDEPVKMLRRLELQAKHDYELAVREHTAACLVANSREKERGKAIAAAARKGDDALEVARRWVDEEVAEPARRRYIVNDSTVEKLGAILNENPAGVMVFRDELSGLLRNLDKNGQEGARSFYLEAWNGTGSFTYDRISRGTLDIESCCVCVLGGIQPSPLRDYMRDVIHGGRGDDGLLQRFQLLVWPDTPREWRNVDRWPETFARRQAWDLYQRLDALITESVGADSGDEDGDIPFLRFNEAAQTLFDQWRGELECRLRAEDEADPLLAHLGKYRSLVPSLALLFHLADNPEGSLVSGKAVELAIGWAVYLESHARRVYAAVADPQRSSVRALAKRIQRGELCDGFALRDVYRPHWSDLETREEAAQAVDMLTSLGWLRAVESQTGGRPSTSYEINPGIEFQFKDATAKSDKSSPGDPFVTSDTAPEDASLANGHDFDAINRLLAEAVEDDK